MAEHVGWSVTSDVAVFFADPHAPRQRGTNENTRRAVAPVPAPRPRLRYRPTSRRHRGRAQRTASRNALLDPPWVWWRLYRTQGGSNWGSAPREFNFLQRSDLKPYSQPDLEKVAAEFNGRPRRTLGFMTPSEMFAEAVASTR